MGIPNLQPGRMSGDPVRSTGGKLGLVSAGGSLVGLSPPPVGSDAKARPIVSALVSLQDTQRVSRGLTGVGK